MDRDIRLTLLRFWQSLGIIGKIKMFFALIVSIAEVDELEKVDIEQMKDQSVIDMVMEEFRKFSPEGARSLIDERDAFIAHNLVRLKEQDAGRILAVVGAGHVNGIKRYLDAPDTLPPFESLTRQPKSFPWATVFGFAVTALFLLLLAAIGFSGVGLNALLYAFLFWVVIHGVFAGAFTLAAGGHPYSALTCFGVAWMTSLNPLLHVGWIAAAVEAKVRSPAVTDFRKIYEAETLTDMARIPLFKVVLIAAVANLGSMLGTFLYFIFLFPVLGINPVVVISTGLHNMVAWVVGLSRKCCLARPSQRVNTRIRGYPLVDGLKGSRIRIRFPYGGKIPLLDNQKRGDRWVCRIKIIHPGPWGCRGLCCGLPSGRDKPPRLPLRIRTPCTRSQPTLHSRVGVLVP